MKPGRGRLTLVSMTGDIHEFRRLLDDMEICILTTLGSDGRFHARPMQLQRYDDDGVLWFATKLDSQKCQDLRENPLCGVAFLKGHTYLSMSARAELLQDRALIRKLWDVGWRAWFPEGPDEPGLVLLKVVPEHAEWVAPSGGTARWLFTGIKNAFTHSHEEPAPKKELDLDHRH